MGPSGWTWVRLGVLLAGLCVAAPAQQVPWTLAASLPGVDDGAVAWADMDGDGDLDLAVAGDHYTGAAFTGRFAEIYRNDSGVFSPIAGLTPVDGAGMDWADYDGDGDPDLAVTGHASTGPSTTIYRNDYGTDPLNPFSDIQAGLIGVGQENDVHSAVKWGDYDGDGDPDLAIAGTAANANGRFAGVYRNDNGMFTLISDSDMVGVQAAALDWGDYDNDGDLDLIICGNDGTSFSNPSTRLYRNDNGTFAFISTGIIGVFAGAVAWGDFDADGWLDLAIEGRGPSGNNQVRVYRNTAGVFVDIGAGLAPAGRGDVEWGDYDCDGDLDLFVLGDAIQGPGGQSSPIYRNDAGVFIEVAAPWLSSGSTGIAGGSAISLGDYDNDGDLDVVACGDTNTSDPGGEVTQVWRNDSGAGTSGGCFASSGWIQDPGHAIPVPVSHLGQVAADDVGRIYLCGGTTDSGVTDTVQRFDPNSETWQLVAPLHVPRSGIAVTSDGDGRIYAIGGGNSSGATDLVERYDPSTGQWSILAPLPEGRSSAKAVALPAPGGILVLGAGARQISMSTPYSPMTSSPTNGQLKTPCCTRGCITRRSSMQPGRSTP